MRPRVALALWLVSATARADDRGMHPELTPTVQFNLSLIVGTTLEPVFAGAFRPELYVAHAEGDVGVGGYALIGGMGAFIAEAGASLNLPISGSFAIAPSLGLARTLREGLEYAYCGGVFAGLRSHNPIGGFDASLGLRVDVRRGFGGDPYTQVVIAIQGDLTIIAALIGMAS